MKLSTLKTSLIGAAALASAFFTGAANATTTFELTGDALNFETFETSTFTASIVFDDDVSDDDSVPGQSSYEFSSLTFSVGAQVFNFGAQAFNAVTIADDFGLTLITIDASNDFDNLSIFGLGFGNFAGTALSNITNIGGTDQAGSALLGLIDTYEFSNIQASAVNAVPEPATWLMMIIGFSIVGAARKRRMIAKADLA